MQNLFQKSNMAFLVLAIGANLAAVNAASADSHITSLAAENFQQADMDHNGVLQYAEFATFIDLNALDSIGKASLIRNRGLYGRAFARIDANNDGVVSPNELQSMVK